MTYQYIIAILQKYDHHFDDKQLNQAIKFLLKYDHNNNHALKISKTLISIYPDTKSVITSLLFFNSIKNNLKLTHIKHHCDEEIAMIFFALAKLFRIQNTYYNTTQETLQLFLSLNPHLIIRVLLIRFAYLLHKLRFNCTISDIEYYLMSEEIKDIYVSLFQEITLEKINNALQNVCLEILHPQLYKFITNFLKENYQNPNQSVIKVINSFHDILSRLDLAYTISGRVKSTHSIAQKLVNKSNVINNLCDIIGIRVIVEQDNECYQVLNTILNDYAHVPNKNKDFIKFPKQNNYQSLHAIIIDKDSRKLEVQIRTKRMHHIAQFGSASHVQYKTNLHNSNNLNIAYEILNKIIFNTSNQYIPTIVHQYLRGKRLDNCISYIIGLIKPNHRTLQQDVFIDHENMLYYRYKSTVYTDHSIDLDLDSNNSIDRLHSPNIYVIPTMSYQVLLSTNYHYKHEVIINCQKYNVEIVGRALIQGGDTTYTVGQLPSEQMEYNLPVSNISALKQTVPIVNIIHTANNLIGADLVQGNVGKCSQQTIHPDVDSKNFKTNSGTALLMAINLQDAEMVQLLLAHPNISINARGMCIAQSISINDGDLPFLPAVHNDNLEIVEKLFAHPQLNIYQINNNQEHALIIATQLGNIEMLRLLVSYLCKEFQDNIEEFERYLNLTNSEGQSALYFAFDYFGFDPCISIKMIKTLLSITNQHGDSLVQDSKTIDITAKLHELFFQEILNGHIDTVAELITITQNNKLVIDVNKSNMTDEYSGTALLMAINLQDAEMVQLLLAHPNISINERGVCIAQSTSIKDGDLPFLLAVHNDNLEIVEKLFAHPQLNIYQINNNQEHALIIATQLGNIEMLRLLVSYLYKEFQDNIEEFERYLNLTNSEGQSALYFAFDYFGFEPCISIKMIKTLLSITNQHGDSLVQDSKTIDITAKLHELFFQEILNGHIDTVAELITITQNNKLVIDVNKSNITDEYSGTALLMAINLQDAEMVQLLLAHPNISINERGVCIAQSTSIKDGDLPFLLAVHNDNLEIVEKLFAHPQLNIYQINNNQEHALIIATQLGNIEMLRLLVSYLYKEFQDNIEEFERYLNLTNSEGQSALYFAFDYFGFEPCISIKMIKTLLSITNQHGDSLVQDSKTIDITAKLHELFFQEILNGHIDTVAELITITQNNKLVIDVNKSNITDEYSGTALLMAINLQDAEMVQLLLAHPNISINERGVCIAQSTSIKDGDLPFLLAVHNDNLEIVEKLFAHPQLNIYQINNNQEHALIIATQLGNIEMLRLLVSYLYKEFQDNIEEFERYLNLTNSEGQSALYFAFDYFGFEPCISIKMIKTLLSITNQHGDSLVQDSKTIDITAKLHELFFQEILNGHIDTVAELITITQNNKLVIDVNKSNITDEYSGTALLMAINLQDAEMVQLLLAHPNISINERGVCIAQSTSIKDGDLPFLLAVHNDNLEIVEKLFAHPQLNIYQINNNQEHALIIATQLGNIEMLRLLVSYLYKEFQDNIEEFERYLNLTNSEGQSALYFAFDYFGFEPCISIKMIKTLLSITNQHGDSLVQDSKTIDITAKLHELFFQEILNGHIDTVAELITITQNNKLVIDVNKSNITDEYSGTALLMAINLQDAEMVQLLLAHPNISINERGVCIAQSTSIKDGDLPFLLAVHNDNLEIVEKLFAHPQLNIYQINNNQEHALIIATQLGNIEMLRLLVSYLYKEFQDNIEEFERYLNLTNSEGQSALYFAFDYFGFEPCISIKMIKTLLSITNQHGDSLVQDSKTIDITAKLHELFFQEILNGHIDTVAELITITQNNKLVIDVNKSNITDEYSGTALLMAINLQDAEMVQLLLAHPNIDINRSFTYNRAANINRDIYTVHPFLEALSSNDRIINLFLKDFDKNKIDILEVDKHGQVCVDNSNEIIIKRNQNSESALMIAIKYGDINILIRLINILKIKLTNDHFKQYLNYVEPFEGNNVLTLAGRQGNKLIVQALLCLQEKDGVPLINVHHQDYCGNRVQHYFTDDQELQYQFKQYATQGLSTKTLKNVITNPQSTHYADEEVKKHIAKLQDTFKNRLTKQDVDQSIQELHNYLKTLDNDYTLCLKDFEDSTISVKCRTTTNVESVSRHMSIKLVPKVVKKLLQHEVESHDTLREVLHLVWLMMQQREKTDNPQNLNFKIDLIKNLNQVAFEYTQDDVTELNVQTMKPPCMKGICNALISSAMPTVPLVNYDEGEKAPGYFAQHPERVKEYLQATKEYTQCELSTAEFRNKWQGMLNKFCPNYTNDDQIVWYDELAKINFILNQSEFLEIWLDIMVIIEDVMNNENKWNKSKITQLLNKQHSNVIMIHQNIEKFLQAEQPQLLQAIQNSELYPIRQLVSKNQACDIITNIVFMFVIHNADIEMAQSLIECKDKDDIPLIQTEYAEMAQDASEQDQGIEQEHLGMLQVFLLVEYLSAKQFDQDKAKKLLMLHNNNNQPLIDTQAADVILQCVHYDGGSVPKSAEETILIHDNLGTTEHIHLLGDNIY